MTDTGAFAARADAPGHPQDVVRTINEVVCIICIVTMTPFVIARVWIRTRIVRTFGKEDWASVIAWLLAVTICVDGILLSVSGGGLAQEDITSDQLMNYNKALYANTILYGPTAFFTRVALLLTFLRVFTCNIKVARFINCFILFMLACYVPILLVKINLCTPIHSFWNPTLSRKCINEHALFVFDTSLAVVSDLVVLFLPIPMVWSLNMSGRKKLRVAAVLSAGGVAAGTSLVRLGIVFGQTSDDTTIDFIRFNLLAIAEIVIGVICGCLPSFSIFMAQRDRRERLKQPRQASWPTSYARRHQLKDTLTMTSGTGTTTLQPHSQDVEIDASGVRNFSWPKGAMDAWTTPPPSGDGIRNGNREGDGGGDEEEITFAEREDENADQFAIHVCTCFEVSSNHGIRMDDIEMAGIEANTAETRIEARGLPKRARGRGRGRPSMDFLSSAPERSKKEWV